MPNILVCLETVDGQPSEASFELLAVARALADSQGARVEALVIGPLAHEARGNLGAANLLIHVEHDSLTAYLPEAQLRVMAQAMRERDPVAVLMSYSTIGMEMGPALAHATGRELISYCRRVGVEADGFAAVSLIYAGRLEARSLVPTRTIFAMIPGAADASAGRRAGSPEVVSLAQMPDLTGLRSAVLARHAPQAGTVDLTKAERIVCVGRGLGGKENLAEAENFAALIGAEIAGSRPVIDSGWLPRERQVGKSGQRVAPKLYIALGVSGAPEHLEGMSKSDCIIAINSDPTAPIFDKAHYGASADMFEVLAELVDALEARG
jgi:electron transfer flavoprotein alpha subunit